MTFERYLEVKALSRFAAEMEPTSRAAFLARVCEGNRQLREQVEVCIAMQAAGLIGRPTKRGREFWRRHRARVAAALVALALLAWLLIVFEAAGAI